MKRAQVRGDLLPERGTSGEPASPPRRQRLKLLAAPPVAAAVRTARLAGFDSDEAPLLEADTLSSGELVRAQTTVSLRTSQIGARVVIVLEDGDVGRPIILGVIQERGSRLRQDGSAPVVVSIDDQRCYLRAEREIVLECGASSITLTRAGKVIIKGTYVLSRSSGYNKIKGAVIDIN